MPDKFTKQSIMGLILLVAMLGGLSVHNYIPQFSLISRTLLATNESIRLSLPAFVFSFAMAQLFYGALSDYFGRRPLYLHGLIIFFIGTMICTFSSSIGWFFGGRLVQGFGIGCSLVLGLAVLRDLYQKEALLKASLYFGVTFMAAILAGPIIGSVLNKALYWQYAFLLLAVYSLAVLMMIYFFLPETNLHPIAEHKLSQTFWAWLRLFRNRGFVGYLLTACLVFCVPLVFYSMAPFILISNHIAPVEYFPALIVFVGICCFLGGLIAYFSVNRLGVNSVIAVGILLWISMSALGLLLSSQNMLDIFTVLLPTGLIMLAVGMVFVSALAAGLASQHEFTGNTAAVLGFFIFSTGGVSEVICAWLGEKTQIPLLGLVLGLAIISLINFWLLVPGNLPRAHEPHLGG